MLTLEHSHRNLSRPPCIELEAESLPANVGVLHEQRCRGHRAVLRQRGAGIPLPGLVDFWAVWCAPCRAIAPIVEQIAAESEGRLKVVKLDVDENGETSIRYGVMNIPTLLLFKGGKVVERWIGVQPKSVLLSRIQPHL